MKFLKNEKKKMSINKIWRLKSVAGQLSGRPKIFAGQNKNLPLLSDSPAVFAKTEIRCLFNQNILIVFFLLTH